jgi:hypothetical protein
MAGGERVRVLAVMNRDAVHADAYRIAHGVVDSTPNAMFRESEEARAAAKELRDAAEVLMNAADSEGRYHRYASKLYDAIRRFDGGSDDGRS